MYKEIYAIGSSNETHQNTYENTKHGKYRSFETYRDALSFTEF